MKRSSIWYVWLNFYVKEENRGNSIEISLVSLSFSLSARILPYREIDNVFVLVVTFSFVVYLLSTSIFGDN